MHRRDQRRLLSPALDTSASLTEAVATPTRSVSCAACPVLWRNALSKPMLRERARPKPEKPTAPEPATSDIPSVKRSLSRNGRGWSEPDRGRSLWQKSSFLGAAPASRRCPRRAVHPAQRPPPAIPRERSLPLDSTRRHG